MEDVTKDMVSAFKDYNLTGEGALKFTAQIGELAEKFGVPLSDMQSALISTADAFKMYGDEAQGAANIMNEYMGALKNTGLSGSASAEIVNNMTLSIKGLNIAQESFMSSQTGGPGGLLGGFKVEQMLRGGKDGLAKVMKMAQQTLEKQMGPVMELSDSYEERRVW